MAAATSPPSEEEGGREAPLPTRPPARSPDLRQLTGAASPYRRSRQVLNGGPELRSGERSPGRGGPAAPPGRPPDAPLRAGKRHPPPIPPPTEPRPAGFSWPHS